MASMDHDTEVTMFDNNSNTILHKLSVFSKHGFQSFCESTTMHGYLEMYRAKSKFWIIFWLAIVAGSVGVTGYQVYQAIDQFMNQSVLTTIEPVSSSDVFYPPLKFCPGHFVYWVDWTKVKNENISLEIILQSLSYLTNVYSSNEFNTTEVDKQLKAEMTKRNFTTLHQFFIFLSKPVILFFDIYKLTDYYILGSYDINDLFATAEVGNSYYTGFQLCYTISNEKLKKFFTLGKKAKYNATLETEMRNQLTLKTEIQYGLEPYKKYVTTEEYAPYIEHWADLVVVGSTPTYKHENYSQYTIPHEFYIDGFSSDPIILSSDVPEYTVKVKASAHKYHKSSKVFPCVDSVQYISSNITCKQICRAVDQMETIEKYALKFPNRTEIDKCMSLELYIVAQPENYIDHVCHYPIVFLYPNQETQTMATQLYDQQNTKPEKLVDVTGELTINETEVQMINQIRSERETKLKECSSKCLPGCEKWNFDYTISARSFGPVMELFDKPNSYTLKVDYPSDGDILIMIEIDSQSWESFVGNVGGLLGIWTGASILSIIQLFYLCCCDESTFECCEWKKRKQQTKSAQSGRRRRKVSQTKF